MPYPDKEVTQKVTIVKPENTTNKLCCVLSPAYKCSGCGAIACEECSQIEARSAYDQDPAGSFDINVWGHLDNDCLKNGTPYGWDITDYDN